MSWWSIWKANKNSQLGWGAELVVVACCLLILSDLKFKWKKSRIFNYPINYFSKSDSEAKTFNYPTRAKRTPEEPFVLSVSILNSRKTGFHLRHQAVWKWSSVRWIAGGCFCIIVFLHPSHSPSLILQFSPWIRIPQFSSYVSVLLPAFIFILISAVWIHSTCTPVVLSLSLRWT